MTLISISNEMKIELEFPFINVNYNEFLKHLNESLPWRLVFELRGVSSQHFI